MASPRDADAERPRHILITGAGGALGRALALYFAAPGAELSLCDIDAAALDKTARAAEGLGATVHWATIDVTDRPAMDRWMSALDAATPLDVAIVNAGISPGTAPGALLEAPDAAVAMVQTNLLGAMNTVYPAARLMAERGRGRIVLISSLSAFNGFPRVPVYAATKAAVRVLGESLRYGLHARGVGLTVVCPGFFRSGMSATEGVTNRGGLTAEEVAARIHRGVLRGRRRLIFPLPLFLAGRLLATLPTGAGLALYRKLFAR